MRVFKIGLLLIITIIIRDYKSYIIIQSCFTFKTLQYAVCVCVCVFVCVYILCKDNFNYIFIFNRFLINIKLLFFVVIIIIILLLRCYIATEKCGGHDGLVIDTK